MDKVIRSPLSYPGGKRWLFSEVYQYIPEGADVVSPFFGGGAIEINCAIRGHRVFGYDAFEPLVNFWQHYLDDPKSVIDRAKGHLLTNGREHFQYMQKEGFYKLKKGLDRATYFYLINKMSFANLTFAGASTRNNHFQGRYLHQLTPNNLQYASGLVVKGLSVENQSVFDTLLSHSGFTYLDPPYPNLSEYLYGDSPEYHDLFDHHQLADILKNRNNWVLSYNDIPYIRKLYDGFKMKPVYRTNAHWNTKNENKNELLIFSPDITPIPTPKQLTWDF